RTHTPMVIYAGQHPQRGNSQDPILAGGLVRLAQPLTKSAVGAQDANEIPILLRRAFKLALEPPRGPVFLAVPTNVMDEECEEPIVASAAADLRLRPAPEVIRRMASMLAGARSPLIICGDGVAIAGGQGELIRLAETVGARVHASFSPELPFPSKHPLYAGLLNVVSAPALKGQLSTADVILAIGTPVLPLLFPLDEPPFPAEAHIVHIDSDASEIGKNWPAEIGVAADPRLTLKDVNEELKGMMTDEQRQAARARADAVAALGDQMMQALE